VDSSFWIAETSAIFIQLFNSRVIVELLFSVVLEALNFETEIVLINLYVTVIEDV
jgi:hypothetical protein